MAKKTTLEKRAKKSKKPKAKKPKPKPKPKPKAKKRKAKKSRLTQPGRLRAKPTEEAVSRANHGRPFQPDTVAIVSALAKLPPGQSLLVPVPTRKVFRHYQATLIRSMRRACGANVVSVAQATEPGHLAVTLKPGAVLAPPPKLAHSVGALTATSGEVIASPADPVEPASAPVVEEK